MDDREHLELAHHHPGRLRLRADAFGGEGGESAMERVRAALEGLPGIAKITHNVKTGSVLVEYEAGHAEPDAIIGIVADTAGILRPLPEDELRKRRTRPAFVAIRAMHELNKAVDELSGNRADLRTLAPAAMAGLAAFSFMVGKDRLPRWDNLLYWSFNIFTSFHRQDIESMRPVPTGANDKPEP